MKQIGQAIKDIQPMSIAQSVQAENGQIEAFVNAVFGQLKSIFPAWIAAWKTQDDIDNAKKIWVRSFIENGITTKRQVSLGLKNCRALKTDFLPSIGRFIDLCKPTPENLGLPSAEDAFQIVSLWNGKPLHPVLMATLKEVDSYALRLGNVSLKQFEYAYMIMVNRFANGEPLTGKVPKAITNGELKGIDAVLQKSEDKVKKQVQEQGISSNAAEARKQALAMLGLKDRKQEARA